MAQQPAGIKMLHPDHETRADGGVYYAVDEAEAMTLSTRGYQRVDDKQAGKGARSAPARGESKSSGSGAEGTAST
ncbi:hypothetical protein GCM10009613_61240 [Pseudonocardia kongjuensis]|uniref:Uncharacterized protein n=1 Tax=Pseudonocardia kongjuensis TaxID=102227 RepID=A0ABP4J2R0_9PSEU